MKVLLYYYYTTIEDTEQYLELHQNFLLTLDVKGRIIISKEGLNGTLSGSESDCNKYMDFLRSDNRFINIMFKIDDCKEHLFHKLSVKIKPYIIKLGEGYINPNESSGIHLSPQEFYDLMKNDDTIVLDVRSNYEHMIGKFKNSITLDIDNFYDFPNEILNHELYLNKDNHNKKILTCCTGGIKCETASAYLKKIGFRDVYQLDGGLINYGHKLNGKDFDGKCYVFDGRISKSINSVNPSMITKCYYCEKLSDDIINCMNTICDKRTIMCRNCFKEYKGCCSQECIMSNKKRKFIPDYYRNEYLNKNCNENI